jgi:hypothetical protein
LCVQFFVKPEKTALKTHTVLQPAFGGEELGLANIWMAFKLKKKPCIS